MLAPTSGGAFVVEVAGNRRAEICDRVYCNVTLAERCLRFETELLILVSLFTLRVGVILPRIVPSLPLITSTCRAK